MEIRSLYAGIHPVTKRPEWQISLGAWGPAEWVFLCALACRDLGPEGLSIQLDHPPNQSLDAQLRIGDEPDTYVAELRLTFVGTKTSTQLTRYQFRFLDQAYPDSVRIESSWIGEQPEPDAWHYVLDRRSRGEGEFISLGHARQVAKPTAPEATQWHQGPVEQDSPFTFPQTAALTQANLHAGLIGFRDQHPDSFLALAHYVEVHDEENEQSEYRWGFLWQDDTAGYQLLCHRLVSSISIANLAIHAHEEDRCFDGGSVDLPARSRSALPERALSWDTAVAKWRQAMGSQEPVTVALWTTFLGVPSFGKIDAGNLVSHDRIAFMFNFEQGSLATDPYLPTWMVEPPVWQSRAMPGSYSSLDAETGTFWRVTSRVELSL